MGNALNYVRLIFAIGAVLLAYASARTIMAGNLEEGLTPGWIDFATAHPMVFAIILVVGATIIGAPFVSFIGNS